jgi:hypothetical protein
MSLPEFIEWPGLPPDHEIELFAQQQRDRAELRSTFASLLDGWRLSCESYLLDTEPPDGQILGVAGFTQEDRATIARVHAAICQAIGEFGGELS